MRPPGIPNRKWIVTPRMFENGLHDHFVHLPPVMLQVLHNRGFQTIASIELFMEKRYERSRDPFSLAGMEVAVNRLKHAIQNGNKIAIYGDYDCDGVTATVLLVEALRRLGMSKEQVIPYIPARNEGYGLNTKALAELRGKGVELVITVDCGVRSVDHVAYANEIGLDMIITDHHDLPPGKLPDALAVINPKRLDSLYPERRLAGVGIAYKLVEALAEALPERARSLDLKIFLDLVAIGTVADLAPLRGENRYLVSKGLEVLNNLRRPGVSSLCQIAGIDRGNVTAEAIGFRLGPRLNAAGRLAHAYLAARLLATEDVFQAQQLAEELNTINRKRQQLTDRLAEKALSEMSDEGNVTIAVDPEFESGIVGLVASKLVEARYRPAIVLEQGPESSHGSCRSIPEVHINDALNEVAYLLEKHGGHAQAAGLTIQNERLPEFKQRIEEVISDQIGDKELVPALEIDAEITPDDVSWELYRCLDAMEPTGEGNRPPLFIIRNVPVIQHRAVGSDSKHLQVSIPKGERVQLKGIAFGQGAWANQMPDRIDLVAAVGTNTWNGETTLQLMIQDIRAAN